MTVDQKGQVNSNPTPDQVDQAAADLVATVGLIGDYAERRKKTT